MNAKYSVRRGSTGRCSRRLIALLLLGAGACAESSEPVQPATPTKPTEPTQPVPPKPESPPDTLERIFVANADGTNWRFVAIGDGPAWSPDGRQLVFHRGFSNVLTPILGSLYVINTDGTGLRLLAQGRWASWSPDGKRILFTDDHGIEGINPDGSGQALLLADGFNFDAMVGPGKPVWSPDGTLIAFQTRDDADIGPQAYVMNADGSGLYHLSHGVYTYESQPAWSPDGKELVYWRYGEGLVVTSASGGEPRTLCRECAALPPSKLVWWPDGFHISFDGGGHTSTTIVDLGYPAVSRFLADVYDLALSRDGSSIAFTSTRREP